MKRFRCQQIVQASAKKVSKYTTVTSAPQLAGSARYERYLQFIVQGKLRLNRTVLLIPSVF